MKNPELQQDEYSLLRPTFPTPKGGTLTVIGWKGRSGSHKNYVVKCDICSQDPELFGDGTFSAVKGNLNKGHVPCGCAFNPRWAYQQNKVRVSREAKERGFKFLGWASEYIGKNTKLLMSCSLHGEWNSTNIDNFLRGNGCPACKAELRLKEDYYHINEFMSTGAFQVGTKFWRSERKNSKGFTIYWNYTCPQCSHDEYVKAGLCSGVFEAVNGSLKNGRSSCRCAKNYRWTKEQREYKIKKEIERRRDNNTANYTFVGWVTEYKNNLSKFRYLCKNHGDQTISVDSFLRGQGCPECAHQSQRQAYINTVMDGDIPVALKLGIANSSPMRLKGQNSRNLFQMTNIGVWEFPTIKACKKAESECKRKLSCGVLNERELKDGWTETTALTNLDAVISIYNKHGGRLYPPQDV